MVDAKEKAFAEFKAKLDDDRKTVAIKSEKDAMAWADKGATIGSNDATLNRQMGLVAFDLGRSSKGNAPTNVDAVYRKFHERMTAPGTGRKAQKADTITKVVSYYNAYSLLGFTKGWDPTEAFAWAMANVKGAYDQRGKIIRLIANETTAPSAERMDEIVKAATEGPSLSVVAKRLQKAGREALKSFPELKDDGIKKKRAAELLMALNNFAAVCQDDGDDDDILSSIMSDAA